MTDETTGMSDEEMDTTTESGTEQGGGGVMDTDADDTDADDTDTDDAGTDTDADDPS